MKLSEKEYIWLSMKLRCMAIVAIVPLKGGNSTSLFEIHYRHQDVLKKAVLRLYDNTEWLMMEPDLLEHEKASLLTLKTPLMHSPDYIASDSTGKIFGYPALLMSYIVGNMNLTDFNMNHYREMAKQIVELHKQPTDTFLWEYKPYVTLSEVKVPFWTTVPELWDRMLIILNEEPPNNHICRIHRDFHPANLLWSDDKVSGVVDWINSCRGPAGIDISHCRVNLAFLHGIEAADAFLQAYRVEVGDRSYYDKYWDLKVFLDFVYPGPPEVYKGWEDFNVTGLTNALLIERADHYLTHILDDTV